MRILGLDISTVATGWAIYDSLTENLIRYDVIKPSKDLNHDQKLLVIAQSVDLILKTYRGITDISIEDTFISKDPTAVKKLNRIAGAIIHLWYLRKGKEANFYMASSARKSMDIPGNSQKEEVTKAVNKRFGLRLKDHNVADAIVVAHCHAVKVKPEIEIVKTKDGYLPKDVVKERRSSRTKR